TLPLQPLTALRLGAGVPLLHGGTHDEMRPFVAEKYNPVTAADYPRIITSLYGSRAAAPILARYPLDRYPSPAIALATVLTDEGAFVGACGQPPADDAAARRCPVYPYEFADPSEAS